MTALLLLVGCWSGAILDPVAEQLANRVVDKAGTPVRLMTATAGIIASVCDKESISVVDLTTHSAEVLGATGVVAPDTGDATKVWVFEGVGVDNQSGTLTLERNAAGTSFDAVYQTNGGDKTMQIAYSIVACEQIELTSAPPPAADTGGSDTGDTGGGDTGDTGGDTGDTGDTGGDTGDTGGDTGDTGGDTADTVLMAVLSATGVFVDGTGDDATSQIELRGDPPYAGLTFTPNTADFPTGGYATWTNATTHENLLLDDASAIDLTTFEWPGKASDTSWTRDIRLVLP